MHKDFSRNPFESSCYFRKGWVLSLWGLFANWGDARADTNNS